MHRHHYYQEKETLGAQLEDVVRSRMQQGNPSTDGLGQRDTDALVEDARERGMKPRAHRVPGPYQV